MADIIITEEQAEVFRAWLEENHTWIEMEFNANQLTLDAENPCGYQTIDNPITLISACIKIDPVLFCEMLVGRKLYKWQKVLLRELAKNKRLSVKSGTGVGKSFCAAVAAIWFFLVHPICTVGLLSSSENNLKTVLWAEMKRVISRLPDWIKQDITVTATKISDRNTDDDQRFIMFLTANQDSTQTLQGFHSEHVLICIDEASFVTHEVIAAFQGIWSDPDSHMMLIGNPDINSGYFYDTHCDDNLKTIWKQISVPSDPDIVESRVSKDFKEDIAKTYGIDSDIYRIKVLAEFPKSNLDSLIPRSSLETPLNGTAEEEGGEVIWGLDIALSLNRDRTALAKRQGNTLLEPLKTWQTDRVSEHINILLNEYRLAEEKPVSIYVDATVIGDAVCQALESAGLPVVPIKASWTSDSDLYYKKRSELWYKCAEWFKKGNRKFRYSGDDRQMQKARYMDLVDELTMPGFSLKPGGKFYVENKEDIRKKYSGKSIDLADSFVLTFAHEEINRKTIPSQFLMGQCSRYNVLEDF